MNLSRRSTGVTQSPKYSISAAARELGVSIYFLRKLEGQGLIRPQRRNDAVGSRIFSLDDLKKVLTYIEAKGGVRDAVALKRSQAKERSL